MARLIKIGKMYYSDLRIPCDGTDCKTPKKPRPHFHRRRKALSSDFRFAETKLADMVKVRNATKRGEPLTDSSWEAFKARFMDFVKTKNYHTYYGYKGSIREFEEIVPIQSLKSLTPERLESYGIYLQKAVMQKKYTLGTIHTKMVHIKAAIKKAVQWKMLEYNPEFREVRLPRKPKGRLHFFSLDEIKQLITAARGVYKTICYLGYYAGLRRGEMRSLRVANIDFERNRIHIEPFGDFVPKDYERRHIPMKPKLREYLKSHINGSQWVLGDKRPTVRKITEHFGNLVRSVGLKGSTHTLRHTFGSHSAMAGVPIPTLSKYLGHSDIKTTQIYVHLSPEHMEQEINRLPDIDLE